MDGPVAGSVPGPELHFNSDASKVEVGFCVLLFYGKQNHYEQVTHDLLALPCSGLSAYHEYRSVPAISPWFVLWAF
ncbi:hypothetical protein NQZ68_031223 [Dissostichus eleginoides]|nr:hypothetical protein NQZ68_031223 [Dissostichus eleginoides]